MIALQFSLAALLDKRPGRGLLLGFFFLLALLIRLVYAQTLPPGLTGEEAEYARIAENLLAGRGYSGVYGGPQLMHAPLFSLLTALVLPLFGDVQPAGMAVSILAGAALAPLLFMVGDEVNGRLAAVFAATMAAVTPMLIYLSATLLSESLTISFMMAAIWATMRLVRSGKTMFAPLMGLLWGLTYLARPTGAVMLLGSLACLAVIAFLLGTSTPRRIAGQSLLALLIFALVAAPYIAFTTSVTGQVALEYKSRYLNALVARQVKGLSPAEAALGIDENFNQAGPQLDQTAFILTGEGGNTGGIAGLFNGPITLGPDNLRRHIRLSFFALTVPLLALAALGLACPPHEKERLLLNGYLALLALGILIVQLVVPQFVARFVAPLVPFIILFAAQGAGFLATRLSGWLKGRTGRSYTGLVIILTGLLLVLLLIGQGQPLRPSDAAVDQLLSKKAVGEWLGDQFGRGQMIMNDGTLIPYYAGGELAPLPYAAEEEALAYIAGREPDFIVLSSYNKLNLPYLEDWLAEGIPAGQAHLVYDQPTLDGLSIQIYRWDS